MTIFECRICLSGLILSLFIVMGFDFFNFQANSAILNSGISERFVNYYWKKGIKLNNRTISKVLRAADVCVSNKFSDGPFSSKDFLALAMIESNFSQYAIGTHGERGIFQIFDYHNELRELNLSNKNIFDIDINVQAACHVLEKKHIIRKDYYETIISYNGYRKIGNRLNDNYWKRFIVARKVVEDLYGGFND